MAIAEVTQAALGAFPFVGSAVVRDGILTRRALNRDFEQIYRDVYISKGIDLDIRSRGQAAWLFSGRTAVLGGFSAAAWHNTKWIPATERAELIWPKRRRVHTEIRIRADTLLSHEVMPMAGMKITTPARTAMDLGCRLQPYDAIATLDALCNATSLNPHEISELIKGHPGSRGIDNLRKILEFVDGGAESPQETRTRLMLIRSGLPVPSTQIKVRNQLGKVFARCDMGWEKWKVSIEYDGKHHWSDSSQRSWDIDRQHLLEKAGWRVIRVSADQLHRRPHAVVELARQKLREAGAMLDQLPRSRLCDFVAT